MSKFEYGGWNYVLVVYLVVHVFGLFVETSTKDANSVGLQAIYVLVNKCNFDTL